MTGPNGSPNPPQPAPPSPGRPRRRWLAWLLGAVVLVVLAGGGIGAWWAITNNNELQDVRAELADTQGQRDALQQQSTEQIAQISQLEEEVSGLETRLAGREGELSTLQAEHGQLQTDYAALEATNGDLREAIYLMDLDAETVRRAAEVIAVLMLPMSDDLPDELTALRDQLATLIGWYESAGDYSLSDSLAFSQFSMAIDGLGDPAMSEAFDAFWQGASGSREEVLGFFEFWVRMSLTVLEAIDHARDAAGGVPAE